MTLRKYHIARHKTLLFHRARSDKWFSIVVLSEPDPSHYNSAQSGGLSYLWELVGLDQRSPGQCSENEGKLFELSYY